MSHSFYSCREPFDFEQSGWGLVEKHLRSNRHQRWNNIKHGPWSWCLHRLKHQFGWSRSQANNEDLLFPIHQSRSIHPLLTIKFFHTLCDVYDFSRLLQRTSWWKTMRSVSSVHYLANQNRHRAALVWHFCKNCVQDLQACSPALLDLLHPIWYLTPVSDIPGRTFAHLRSAVVGMLNYPGLGHRLRQSDPGNFAISSPSAWNFLQVDLRDPGFSLIALRWKVNAFLFSLFV